MAVGGLTAGDRDDEEGLEHLRVEQRVVPALQRPPVVRDGDAVAVAQRLDQAHDIFPHLLRGVCGQQWRELPTE